MGLLFSGEIEKYFERVEQGAIFLSICGPICVLIADFLISNLKNIDRRRKLLELISCGLFTGVWILSALIKFDGFFPNMILAFELFSIILIFKTLRKKGQKNMKTINLKGPYLIHITIGQIIWYVGLDYEIKQITLWICFSLFMGILLIRIVYYARSKTKIFDERKMEEKENNKPINKKKNSPYRKFLRFSYLIELVAITIIIILPYGFLDEKIFHFLTTEIIQNKAIYYVYPRILKMSFGGLGFLLMPLILFFKGGQLVKNDFKRAWLILIMGGGASIGLMFGLGLFNFLLAVVFVEGIFLGFMGYFIWINNEILFPF